LSTIESHNRSGILFRAVLDPWEVDAGAKAAAEPANMAATARESFMVDDYGNGTQS
jgi:hypothetical protein